MQITVRVVHRHGPGKCGSCPSRDQCKTLCSEADAIANQDYVPQREMTIGFYDMQDNRDNEPSFIDRYTKTEKSIVTLLLKGLNSSDICELLDISRNALRVHRHRILKKSNKSS